MRPVGCHFYPTQRNSALLLNIPKLCREGLFIPSPMAIMPLVIFNKIRVSLYARARVTTNLFYFIFLEFTNKLHFLFYSDSLFVLQINLLLKFINQFQIFVFDDSNNQRHKDFLVDQMITLGDHSTDLIVSLLYFHQQQSFLL